MRAALAGAAAFLLALVLEVPVLGVIGPAREILLAILLAPVMEEGAKRLAMLGLGAAWGMTGLAFGVIEGGLKLAEWHMAGVAGGVASVLQHWAYGRFAEGHRHGIWLAMGLHAGFNGMVVLVDLATGGLAGWFAPLAAGLLLWASFRRKWVDRGVDAGGGHP